MIVAVLKIGKCLESLKPSFVASLSGADCCKIGHCQIVCEVFCLQLVTQKCANQTKVVCPFYVCCSHVEPSTIGTSLEG